MDTGQIKYDSSDQDTLTFWNNVPEGAVHVRHVFKMTTVEIGDVLNIARTGGVSQTEMIFWEKDTEDDVSLVGRFTATDRPGCITWISSEKKRTLRLFEEDEETSPGEVKTYAYHVTVSADTDVNAEWYADQFISNLPELPQPRPTPTDRVLMDFCLMNISNGGARTFTREIDAPSWDEIQQNYSAPVVERFGKLLVDGPENINGKVGVLTGPPGTGKTHLLRCLAREWREHTKFTYVTDPHRLFAESGYLLDLLLGNFDSTQWNALIIEDAEKYIAARGETRQSNALQEDTLTTLLNLGDGMLGQGFKIKILFTTNAEDGSIDPAVVRRGRCFLNLDIPLLSGTEAFHWLKDHEMGPDPDQVNHPMVLADLYAALNADQ